MVSSGLRKMLFQTISNTWWCMSVGVSYNFWNCAVFPYILWQMLLSYVLNASGVPWQMLLSYIYCGRCYCHVICGRWCDHRGRWYYLWLSKVAHVIANWLCFVWQMVSHYVFMLQLIFGRWSFQGGRCNSHWVNYLLQFQFWAV